MTPFEPPIEDLPEPSGKGVELVREATLMEERAAAVRLRVAGRDYQAIADVLGIELRKARMHCDAWVRSRRPAPEIQDELTKISDARLEILHEVWWPKAREGDERALDNVLKILDRRAKIMGLEVKKPSTVTIVTAEAIVEVLGLGRGAPPAQVAVDVQALELDAPPREEVTG